MRFEPGQRGRLATGGGRFLADLHREGLLEAAFSRSPLPHALIRSLRVPDPGLGGADMAALARPLRVAGPGLAASEQPALATSKVRFAGEALAIVAAGSRAEAEDLAELVEADLDPCPASEPLHAGAPDGVLFRAEYASGDVETGFAAAAHIVEATFRTSRSNPLPLECRGVLAEWDAGRLTVWSSTQVPDLLRTALAGSLGLAAGQVRVVVPDVGGGFGLKAHVFPEELAVAALARRLGCPIRWVEDRSEALVAASHAHDEVVEVRLALSADGLFLAAEAAVTADVGAYSITPFSASLDPITTAQTLLGSYRLPAYRFTATALASSKAPAGAYRGVGMCAGVHAGERLVELAAARLGLDSLELRRRNLVTSFPHANHAGRTLDSGDYAGLLDTLHRVAGYEELKQERDRARAEGRWVGIGVALFNEHSGTGAAEYRSRGIEAIPGFDAARVRVGPGGEIEISTSSAEAGQDHARTYRMLAARELGVAPERVTVVEGDTDLCPPGTGTFVSRGAVGQLSAVALALREAAARDLEPGLDVVKTVDPRQVFPSGAHLAVVEVDPVGFVPRVTRYVAVEDCGRVVDPEAVEDQVRGGVATGIGGVLLEEFRYSLDGQPLSSTLLDYLVPLAVDVPDVELHHLESPSPWTELGSKGVGEAGTIGAFGAVANAVADALAPEGAVITDLPCSPARLHAALSRAGTARVPTRADPA